MRRAQQAIRVALFAAALAPLLDASLGDSRLPLTCKNIARDVIMNSCKGSRIKRAPLDQGNLNEELKIDASGEHEKQAPQQKRQWGFGNGAFGGYNGGYSGGYGGGMESSYHNTELELPGLEFSDDRGTQMENQFVPGYPPLPYGSLDPFSGPFGPGRGPIIRSADSRDLLGYHLSSEELEELYEEIGERMPRNSKDLNKKIFLNVAAKCCPNVKLCYENPSLIPCMGY